MYSASGGCAYLSVRARAPGIRRAEIEAMGFLDVPCVRSNMLIPPADLAVALAAGRRSNAERFRRLATNCKVSAGEVRELAASVAEALATGPLPVDQIRDRVPARLIRNLGEAGRKLGDTTTLPVALRELQVEGRALRVPADGRWDSERFVYRLSQPPEHVEDGELDGQLAQRFFTWAGPATLEEFAWWANLGTKAARAAISKLGLEPVRVAGWSDEAWQFPGAPKAEAAGLKVLPFRDSFLYFRRNLAVFLDARCQKVELLDFNNKLKPLSRQQTLHHHAIVLDGRLIGAWEYDPENEDIAWTVWEEGRGVKRAVEEAAAFIREELGDLAFYALDAGRARRMRIESLR
jgi:hypothetical protein